MSFVNILQTILSAKAKEVAAAQARVGIEQLEDLCEKASPPRPFFQALREQPIAIIAEVKRASPSAGVIRPGADPAQIAIEYTRGGAAAISCLTDEQFFDGHLSYIQKIRESVPLPVLRKDFLIDRYQVVEARAAGADAILLIVAALSKHRFTELLQEAGRWGMEVLVETHSETEAHFAVEQGASIIGVNHRNLSTFSIDMSLTAKLRPIVPKDTILVGESGIHTASDIIALARAGANAVLIGESLMRAPNVEQALAKLREETIQCLS